MKKFFLASTVIVLTSISLHSMAQTSSTLQVVNKKEIRKQARAIRKIEVGERTLSQFAIDFPGAKRLTSGVNSNMSVIAFISNGVEYKAYYDIDNNLIGTISHKLTSDLPAAALKSIKKHYPGYTISNVILFDDNEANDSDMLLYGRQFADADNYFAELQKDGKAIVLQVKTNGQVYFFKNL
ncbi:hypothetical protein [Flavitalea sp.]|nr:hypothetical protein [Flavitalea sp.]